MGIGPDLDILKQAMHCRCPRCGVGALFSGKWTPSLASNCAECGLDFSRDDSADGPAVFLIFVLGVILVPLALWFEATFSPPVWVHGILWSVVTLGLTFASLRPLKSYIIALQFKHRPEDWS